MELSLNRSNIAIVLVEPRGSGNIGSIARAMKNMGFADLRLVSPQCDFLDDEARKMASNSREILESAKIFSTLDEAVADCATLVATSHKPKRYKKNCHTARELGAVLAPFCAKNKVAILFGRENHGLSNDEVKMCPWLVHIPAASQHPSLNIAQAVFTICYELFLHSTPTTCDMPELVGQQAMEAFYARVLKIIDSAGFRHKNDDTSIFLTHLRRIFGRTGLDKHELSVMFKLFRQFEILVEKSSRRD